ncbi:50S ribosomal protein L2 [Candidatus Bathyarchaeota archaeon]|nr:50S ribosomal protein L2 [Candidatus Bathyarchaeota archaeon]NIU81592.1 50S ribosomal protein L2 [Candidatus Bathyarchaeota archaeon]NIV68237.1 50S ribosomal protein L2 [Candidatus Bathyarchaeota archaeon]NIW15985.1 50S ribosomal protein L2 [Candidatus Bathyarchaeota archaeon]NIW34762.1 50S ribosomal protein L2 [Candidatus Bathyarchaeota archaeon]
MGKRIRVQRRGRGAPTFRASTHKRVAPVQYPPTTDEQREAAVSGKVAEILHDPGRGSPLASVELETGETYHTVIPEGVYEGQQIQIGSNASIEIGNTLPIGKIPEGTMICNIELSPDDGGKMARSSGAYATVVAHTPEGTMIKLPSGKNRYVHDLCRATIGVVSGAGRVEKPFLKAGDKYHLKKAKGHLYPRTRGRAMIAAVHPYGSSKRGARKVTTVSRHASPGKKVGLIAARSAGRKKRKR